MQLSVLRVDHLELVLLDEDGALQPGAISVWLNVLAVSLHVPEGIDHIHGSHGLPLGHCLGHCLQPGAIGAWIHVLSSLFVD